MSYSKHGLEHGTEMEHKYMKDWPQFKDLCVPFLGGKSLLPWQRLGVVFLHFCRSAFGYALLGDEMGVGKVLD